MRLCFMIHALSSGGAERVLSELANHYARKGIHDVHLITLQPKDTPSFYALDPSITLHQLGLNQGGAGGLSKIKRVLGRLFSMRRMLKNLQPHKIISFVDEMNIAILLATLGLSIPVVISERTDPRRHSIGVLGNIGRRLIYPLAFRLVLQGNYVRSCFPYLSQKTTVISNPVAFPKDAASKIESSFIIMLVGRLDCYKGHYELIQAFSTLAQKFPKWSLEIYGEGPEKDNLEKLIAKHSLQECAFLKGVSSPIQKELKRASLFAFPTHYEGFSNALAEAMALGLPVVASNCDGNLELVEHEKNALVFPVGDVDKLAEQLSLLMSDAELRVTLGKAARQSIKKFAPEKIYKMWDEVIETSADDSFGDKKAKARLSRDARTEGTLTFPRSLFTFFCQGCKTAMLSPSAGLPIEGEQVGKKT